MNWVTIFEGRMPEVKLIEEILKDEDIPFVTEVADEITPAAIFGFSAIFRVMVPEDRYEDAKKALEMRDSP